MLLATGLFCLFQSDDLFNLRSSAAVELASYFLCGCVCRTLFRAIGMCGLSVEIRQYSTHALHGGYWNSELLQRRTLYNSIVVIVCLLISFSTCTLYIANFQILMNDGDGFQVGHA